MTPENHDELDRLRRANPVPPGSVPSANSPRAQALFEEITMSDDAATTNRRSAIGSSRRRWVAGIAAAIVLIGSGAAALALRSPDGRDGATDLDAAAQPDEAIDCPDRPRPPAPEEGSNTLSSPRLYSSLDDLTGASELVVLGEVTEVGREVSGAQPGYGGFQSPAVTLKVKEVYRGEVSGDTVVFHEYGWSLGPSDQPTAEPGVHRSQVGDCGFYFLTRPDSDSVFFVTSPQGRFIAEGQDEVFAAYERSDPLSDELAAMSFSELRSAVKESAERMEDVSPRDVQCRQPGPTPDHCKPSHPSGIVCSPDDQIVEIGVTPSSGPQSDDERGAIEDYARTQFRGDFPSDIRNETGGRYGVYDEQEVKRMSIVVNRFEEGFIVGHITMCSTFEERIRG